jgi:hypothetical protein
VARLGRLARLAILLLPLVIAIPALLIHGPLPQDLAYHGFADQRSWLGIPNAGNVLTNAFFLLAGALGLGFVIGGKTPNAFLDPRERGAWVAFFAGVALTAFGSAYYHLAPGNDRLFWDRLPMTLAFMSLLAAVIGERLSVELGSRLLWPLIVLGAASVVLWRLTENAGRGDVRLYGVVEFYPLVAIPLLLLLFPPRYTGTSFLVSMAGVYVSALLFEALDGPILRWTGAVSGHSLKHVAAAGACFLVIPLLARRAVVPVEPDLPVTS